MALLASAQIKAFALEVYKAGSEGGVGRGERAGAALVGESKPFRKHPGNTRALGRTGTGAAWPLPPLARRGVRAFA